MVNPTVPSMLRLPLKFGKSDKVVLQIVKLSDNILCLMAFHKFNFIYLHQLPHSYIPVWTCDALRSKYSIDYYYSKLIIIIVAIIVYVHA